TERALRIARRRDLHADAASGVCVPRRRKSYVPELAVLLRNAQPTSREITGEPDPKSGKPDPKKRQQATRGFEVASDELVKRYRRAVRARKLGELDPRVRTIVERWKELVKRYRLAERSGKLDELDPCVRTFVERWLASDDGCLPKSKGGRPPSRERRLIIAV